MSNNYKRINLVSNNKSVINGNKQDPNLINSWGIVKDECTIWIANNESSTITHYDMNGSILSDLIYTDVLPTGLVVNESSGFVLSNTTKAHLINVTKEGLIEGYNSLADPIHTIFMAQGYTGSNFTGVVQNDDKLYIADYGTRSIVLCNYDWTVNRDYSLFNDPYLPPAYNPYNVAVIDGYLYVTYGKKSDPNVSDPEYGSGLGIINIFNIDGSFVRRFATYGALNAPWGIIELDSKYIAVGNRGDGIINIYNKFGIHVGTINENNNYIKIDGLYGLVKSNCNIYFSAGPENGQAGQFGVLVKK